MIVYEEKSFPDPCRGFAGRMCRGHGCQRSPGACRKGAGRARSPVPGVPQNGGGNGCLPHRVPGPESRHNGQQRQFHGDRAGVLPQALLQHKHRLDGPGKGPAGRSAGSGQGSGGVIGQSPEPFLPELLHLWLYAALVAMVGLGKAHRLDGPERSEPAAGHYRTGIRLVRGLAGDGPEGRRDPRILQRSCAPALAQDDQHRRMAGAAAPFVAEGTAGAAG